MADEQEVCPFMSRGMAFVFCHNGYPSSSQEIPGDAVCKAEWAWKGRHNCALINPGGE